NRFDARLQLIVDEFDGPVATVFGATAQVAADPAPLRILVPTGGSPEAKLAMEIGLALAKASGGSLSALHVFNPDDNEALLRGVGRREGLSVLVDARRLGRRSGVDVEGLTVTSPRPMAEISRLSRTGRFDLLVLGVTLRRTETRFLSPRGFALVQSSGCPVLLVGR
ncbi:MAG: universal stress protein, partial [Proteobacteria bacterium]|nr:universal stress protein [Pseudomonadota bacterium]